MPGSGIDREYERRVAGLVNSREARRLAHGRRGLEREALRVTEAGRIAQTPHPIALGSALTNRLITTDYSEALTEFVTPTFTDNAALLRHLAALHRFAYRRIGPELLWATSMPCEIDGDAEVPIARYGRSHQARIKTIYRHGLQVRYGGMMQAISGVHFNYSLPQEFWPLYAEICRVRTADTDFVSERYFDLLRSYRRHGWLVYYLFGVSPALCRSFLQGRRDDALDAYGAETLIGPYATSLRMSDLGYRNRKAAEVAVSVNGLAPYLRDLRAAVAQPHPPFAALGVRFGDQYQQLSANVLQIENEYYSYIRPKRAPRAGERTTQALARAGVEYVEVRALDNSAFDTVGVNLRKLCFLEAFLQMLLLKASPPIEPAEEAEIERNHLAVARRGRLPGLMLERGGRAAALREWSLELLDSMQGVCELLDAGHPDRPYTATLAEQRAKIEDAARTPSARLLHELREHDESFAALGLRLSRAHRDRLEREGRDEPRLQGEHEFEVEAEESWRALEALEAAERGSFEEYLAHYLSP